MSNGLTANISVSTNSHYDDKEGQEQTSSSREKGSQLESQTHPEYGMVIGIGVYLSHTPQDDYLLTQLHRSWNNVSIYY